MTGSFFGDFLLGFSVPGTLAVIVLLFALKIKRDTEKFKKTGHF